jgi:hypothetical protein
MKAETETGQACTEERYLVDRHLQRSDVVRFNSWN